MFRLTRDVRLNVPLGGGSAGGGSGHAGVPAVDGPAVHWTVGVTLAGRPAAESGYLIDIKAIDDGVRRHGTPLLARAVGAGRALPQVVRSLYDGLADAWPGHRLERVALTPSPFHRVSVRAQEAPVVRLSHRFEFSAAHRLHNPALDAAANARLFGKCNNAAGHGHNYEVEVTLAGEPGPDGLLIGVAELERLVDTHAIAKVDHKHLNLQVAAFADLNPSVEHIAQVLFGWLKAPLSRPGVKLARVTVWETPKTSCAYSEEETAA